MAPFDHHDKCARCREKKVGQDPCVLGNDCLICEGFSDLQKEKLATPSYKIRKERKAGLLVFPKEMTVLGSLDDEQSSVDSSAHPSAQAPASASPSASHSQSFVTAQQFEAMNDKWADQFARFEALLSRGSVFTTPKTAVSSLPSHMLVSSQPFINPSARHTGPVVPPADQDSKIGGESKAKQKPPKSSKSGKTGPWCTKYCCFRSCC